MHFLVLPSRWKHTVDCICWDSFKPPVVQYVDENDDMSTNLMQMKSEIISSIW